MSPRARRAWRATWPPIVFGVAFLTLWELAVVVFGWKPYFLPKPSEVWSAFVDNFALIRGAAVVSGRTPSSVSNSTGSSAFTHPVPVRPTTTPRTISPTTTGTRSRRGACCRAWNDLHLPDASADP